MKKYSYLIFDFDGTLADTNKGIVDTFQETFRRMNLPVPTREAISATIGLSLKDGFLGARGGMTAEQSAQAVKIYRAIFPEIAYPVITAFPGVVDTLKTLREMGYRMSIATSRSHCTLEILARQIGVADFFDGLFGAEDVVNHKPAPDLVNLIVGKYGLDRNQVLVIGDANFDILMGHGAGCDVCAVSWGNQSRDQLSEHNPELLVDSPSELLGVLEKCWSGPALREES